MNANRKNVRQRGLFIQLFRIVIITAAILSVITVAVQLVLWASSTKDQHADAYHSSFIVHSVEVVGDSCIYVLKDTSMPGSDIAKDLKIRARCEQWQPNRTIVMNQGINRR